MPLSHLLFLTSLALIDVALVALVAVSAREERVRERQFDHSLELLRKGLGR